MAIESAGLSYKATHGILVILHSFFIHIWPYHFDIDYLCVIFVEYLFAVILVWNKKDL